MSHLITNELKKLFYKKTIYVFLLSFIAISIAFAVFSINTRKDIYGDNWKATLTETNKEILNMLENKSNYSDEIRKGLTDSVMLNKYMIDNNISPNVMNFKSFILNAKDLSPIIIIFLIYIYSAIITDEFSEGKIILLLIRPYKRWKIILSKLIVSQIISVIIWAGLILVLTISGLVFFGNGEGTLISVVDGIVIKKDQNTQILYQYLSLIIQSMGIGIFTFLISCIVNARAIAMSLGVVAYLLGGTIGKVLGMLKFSYKKYEFFTLINSNNLININNTEIISVSIMILIYISIFILLSIHFFQRRTKSI